MNLAGRLATTTLGDLLGALYREQATGVLELTEESGATAGRTHRIHLARGLICQIETPLDTVPLGRLLQRTAHLSEEVLRDLLRRRPQDGVVPLGRWLVEHGMVAEAELTTAVRQQLVLRLEAIFGLRGARIAFRSPRPRSKMLDPQRPLAPEEFLHGRPRARTRRESPGVSSPQPAGTLGERVARRNALMTLGLPPTADPARIRQAFRQLAAAVHPDRFPHAQGEQRQVLDRRFAELSAAYHRLAG